ncbi:MAG TPA: radical SAM family heme chaperone HemW [Saprospiraceae bacterium]|nr:MAG: oxygen-independent coproporphyrinogen III oxidase [Candidatus Parvibacillus calidus]MCC7149674.1 radical SAM family heme chaperone HemW [Saprospiraceae bacterium]WKZ62693.1 MAG: radical SAM family heme chaperone HemW [Saprospiraceae bacterium]HRN35051.1 radical SAM family heme chaperone HemW [Saprospiraceae bacterium]HRP84759.1 radical SAM family heme chaperone HemW [Saprospiraceae bacterium]
MSFSGGLYIHIPFCRQACHYCNFHFTTSLHYKSRLVEAINREIRIRAAHFEKPELKTIYFGGGSPSLLSISELNTIMESIHRVFNTSGVVEITLEANPDDLTPEYIRLLKTIGIDRLSIGIQSFYEEDLMWMHRAHNNIQAMNCIPMAQDIGLEDISVDLIFGFPLLTDEKYMENLKKLTDWNIPHISAYSLTVEDKTPLAKSIRKGIDSRPDEGQSARQFVLTHHILEGKGYEHYEISNFSLPGWHAIHNSNYWLGVPYIGVGPAAHSFYEDRRYWNIANNQKYMHLIESGQETGEYEIINPDTAYNELILTRLRTKWGVDRADILRIGTKYADHFDSIIGVLIDNGIVEVNANNYKLTFEGQMMADHWTEELFI